MSRVWVRPNQDSELTIVSFDLPAVFDEEFKSMIAMPFPGEFPGLKLTVTSDFPPADFFNPGVVFTVSERLRAVMEEFPIRAEFHPVRVIYRKREYRKSKFFFCNILDMVDCFDRNKGKYTYESKPEFRHCVRNIHRLAVDESKTAGHHLFRIANGGEYLVCVSDQLAQRVQQEKFTGVRFVTPEDWRFGILVDFCTFGRKRAPRKKKTE